MSITVLKSGEPKLFRSLQNDPSIQLNAVFSAEQKQISTIITVLASTQGLQIPLETSLCILLANLKNANCISLIPPTILVQLRSRCNSLRSDAYAPQFHLATRAGASQPADKLGTETTEHFSGYYATYARGF